jgi:hypothetical protein
MINHVIIKKMGTAGFPAVPILEKSELLSHAKRSILISNPVLISN